MKKILLLAIVLYTLSWKAEAQKLLRAPLNSEFELYQKSGKKPQRSEKFNKPLDLLPSPVVRHFGTGTKSNTQFASSYDLRSTSYLTSVKRQGECGSCWTFATMGAIESQWKKLGIGTYDLSEENLKECHGFDWSPCEGGNLDIATDYLTNRKGPISETDDPYTETAGTCTDGLIPQGYVTDVRFVPNIADSIKQALIDNGALYTNMCWNDTSYNETNYTYYYSGSEGTNHAVLLVGWDDSKVTAGGTGAWIIRNSWGSDWGENGFFYISYNDVRVNSTVGFFPSRIDYDENTNLYAYDQFGQTTSYGYGSSTAYAVVKFVSDENISISKLGFYMTGSGSITYSIYSSFDGSTLSDELLANQSQECVLPGYYTFDLPSNIEVSENNDYYIRIQYYVPDYSYPIPIEALISDYCSNTTVDNPGFWISSSGNSWSIVTDYDPCVKVYAQASLYTNDLQLLKLYAPASGANLTSSETIKVTVKNKGTAAQSNFPVSMKVDGGAVFTETISSSIEPGDTLQYTFSATADLSADGTHSIVCYTNLDNDERRNNDTLRNETRKIAGLSLPYTESFNASGFPDEWAQTNISTSNRWNVVNNNVAGGSAYELQADDEDVNPASSRIILPVLNTSGYDSIKIKFKHYFDDYGTGMMAGLETSTDGINWHSSSFQITSGEGSVGPKTEEFVITADVNSSTTYISFIVDGNLYQFNTWSIDDIEIDAALPTPSNLTAVKTDNLVALNWEYTAVTGTGFDHFAVYRNDTLTATTNELKYTDTLTYQSCFNYKIAAVYNTGINTFSNETSVCNYSATQWTYMLYLYEDGTGLDGADDFNEIEASGSVAGIVNFVVLYDAEDDNMDGIYLVQKDDNGYDSTIISTKVSSVMGTDPDMNNWETLRDFILWAQQNYPAAHYGLNVWDHGSGIFKKKSTSAAKYNPLKSAVGDMKLWDLANAVDTFTKVTGQKLDIMGFDVCLLGQVETAYQLRNLANVVVASEITEPGDGWDYEASFARLKNNPSISAEDFASGIVSDYQASYDGGSQGSETATLAATSTQSLISVLIPELNNFSDSLIKYLDDYSPSIIEAMNNTYYSDDITDHKDLGHFAAILDTSTSLPSGLHSAAANLIDKINVTVLANGHTGSETYNVTGLKIWMPSDISSDTELETYYTDTVNYLKFSQTHWDEFLYALALKTSISDAYESDNTIAEAKTISYNETQTHSIYPLADKDYVKFEITNAPINISIETNGTSGDTYLYLIDSDMSTILGSNDDNGTSTFSLINYTIQNNGTYYALVTDFNNNDVISSYTITLSLSNTINDISSSDDIQIYPNPTSGKLNVDLPSTASNASFKLFDITGKTISSGLIENDQPLDFSTQPEGMYLLKIESETFTSTQKLIIRK